MLRVFKRGYSLIELSIVLVILGTIFTIYFGNWSYKKAISVNGVIQEWRYFEKAVKTFRTVYGYWPGDISSAYLTGRIEPITGAPYLGSDANANYLANYCCDAAGNPHFNANIDFFKQLKIFMNDDVFKVDTNISTTIYPYSAGSASSYTYLVSSNSSTYNTIQITPSALDVALPRVRSLYWYKKDIVNGSGGSYGQNNRYSDCGFSNVPCDVNSGWLHWRVTGLASSALTATTLVQNTSSAAIVGLTTNLNDYQVGKSLALSIGNVGYNSGATGFWTGQSRVIDPVTAKRIDLKGDDGYPFSGLIESVMPVPDDATSSTYIDCVNLGNSYTAASATAAQTYWESNTTGGCSMVFVIDQVRGAADNNGSCVFDYATYSNYNSSTKYINAKVAGAAC